MAGSADEALAQIRDRKCGGEYEKKAERKGMEIIPVGISFSSKDRQIAEWKSES